MIATGKGLGRVYNRSIRAEELTILGPSICERAWESHGLIYKGDRNGFGELQARTAEANGTAVYSATYTRDAAGRIAQTTRSVEGESHTWAYTYDDAGRLTKVTRDGTPVHLYQYGPNGNRTSHTGPSGTTTATYDDRDRLALDLGAERGAGVDVEVQRLGVAPVDWFSRFISGLHRMGCS